MTWEAFIEMWHKYWAQYFMAAIGGVLTVLWRKLTNLKKEQSKVKEEQKKEDEMIKTAVKALLLDRCYQGAEFFLERGSVNDASLKVLMKMYDAYCLLGDGDPAIGVIIKDVENLPKNLHRND